MPSYLLAQASLDLYTKETSSRSLILMPPKRRPPAQPAQKKAPRQSALAKENGISAATEASIKETFNLFATSKTSLPSNTLRRALTALNVPPSSAEEYDELLSAADPEDEGWISYSNFVAIAALKLNSQGEEDKRKEVEDAFQLFLKMGGDGGHKGKGRGDKITMAMLRKVAGLLKEDVGDDLLRDMMLEANGGAGVGSGVGIDEFEGVMRRGMPWHLRHRSRQSKDLSNASLASGATGVKQDVPIKGNKDLTTDQNANSIAKSTSTTQQDDTTIAKVSYWDLARKRLKDEDGGVYEALEALLQEVPNSTDDLPSQLSCGSFHSKSKVLEHCTKVTIELHDHSMDIRSYVQNEVKHGPRQLLEKNVPDLENGLIDTLCARAQGMFRWVELQLAIFLDEDESLLLPESVEDRLHQLENEVRLPDLAAVYTEIYERNGRKSARDRKHASKCYRLILCSEVPLRGPDLAEAVALNPDRSWNSFIDETYIQRICSNFLIIIGSEHVRFAHLSVIEYLKGGDFSGEFSDQKAHTQAAELHTLLDRGADTQACDQRGANTALDLASRSGHSCILKVLVRVGAKHGVKVGRAPNCAPSHRPDFVRLADDGLTLQTLAGFGPALFAGFASNDDLNGLIILLGQLVDGRDLVAQDECGLSALSRSLYADRNEVVKALLKHVDIKDVERLHMKESRKFVQLFQLLKQLDDTSLAQLCKKLSTDHEAKQITITLYCKEFMESAASTDAQRCILQASRRPRTLLESVTARACKIMSGLMSNDDIFHLLICVILDTAITNYE
ncbi:MAG: hypothetical protein Q9163_004086 [Psora crenata]